MSRYHLQLAFVILLVGVMGGVYAATTLPSEIPSGITLTLNPADNPHYLRARTTTVVKAGGALVCPPDTLILAGEGAKLLVQGRLDGQRAKFRGQTWAGIEYLGSNSSGELTGCKVIQAGQRSGAAVTVRGTKSVRLTRCHIMGSLGYGLEVASATLTLDGNTLADNGKAALILRDGGVLRFPSGSAPIQFTGNRFNGTLLDWQKVPGDDCTLARNASPYLTRRTLFVEDNKTLTIQRGVEVRFEGRDVGVLVEGTLQVRGAETAPVVLKPTATLNPPGWRGIEFRANNATSVLRYCRIERAGAGNVSAAVLCRGWSGVVPRPTLDHCAIVDSATNGLRSVAAAPRLAACQIRGATGRAIICTYGGFVDFINPCTATGNGNNAILFQRAQGIVFPQVWKPGGLPYQVLGPVVTQAGGELTIAAGMTVYLGPQAAFSADKAPIKVLGTATQRVEFVPLDMHQGWGGFFIQKSGSGCIFRHCVIKGGGIEGEAHIQAVNARANGGVIIDNVDLVAGRAIGLYLVNSVVQLTGSQVRKHGGVGIVANSGTRLTVDSSALVNNGLNASTMSTTHAHPRGPLDCTLARSQGTGLYAWDSVITLTNAKVSRNRAWGIVAGGTTQLTMTCSEVAQNAKDGIYNASSERVYLSGQNVLLDNGGFEVANTSTNWVQARNNYWGVTTPLDIENRIYDRTDSTSVGEVVFQPFLTERPDTTGKDTESSVVIPSATAVLTRGGVVQISYVLSAPASVTVEIVNLAGRPIRRFSAINESTAGTHLMLWNLTNEGGLRVPNGCYVIRLIATTPSGAQAHALVPVTVGAR
ncbi:MAG: hypothetical protein ACUVX8_10145 [Candidatus Zipacnadales bacterium]